MTDSYTRKDGLAQFGEIRKQSRADTADRLMGFVDNKHVVRFVPRAKIAEDTCPHCDLPVSHLDGGQVACQSCHTFLGYTHNIDVDVKCGEVKQQSHNKIKHFIPILNKIQGQMVKPISEEELNKIIPIIRKQLNHESINHRNVQNILKAIGEKKHYNNIPYFIRIIRGCDLFISNHQKSQMISMFQAMNEIYKKYIPENRINSFSYDYIAYKFCQILDVSEEVRENIKLIKDAAKKYDPIWERIASAMKWPQHSTPI